jgi:uncharacterized membrane protein YdbT with pleckstrin-like domain
MPSKPTPRLYRTSKTIFVGDVLLMPIIIGFFTFFSHLVSYFSQSIRITSDSIELKKGIINIDRTEVPHSKINSIQVRQGIFGRLFNFGNVTISTGNDTSGIVFKHIESPNELKDSLTY